MKITKNKKNEMITIPDKSDASPDGVFKVALVGSPPSPL